MSPSHLKDCVPLHWDIQDSLFFFFACSMAECIESHSIWVCPDSKNFCSMISICALLETVCSNPDAKNVFLFWPEQQSEYSITCLTLVGNV